MARAMSAVKSSRRAETEPETKPYALSKYEHLEILVGTEEIPGREPVKGYRTSRNEEEHIKIKSRSNWRTLKLRRRQDGKAKPNIACLKTLPQFADCCPPTQVFRAAEYVDETGLMDDAKATLLRVLNHPNIISLIDVVQAQNTGSTAKDYTVWEDCNRGTLNRLLWHEPGQKQM